MAAHRIPQRFGRYEVLGQIGAGGMGVVLRCQDPKLGREVAVKAVLAQMASTPTVAERFRREALSLARLSHPNIVRVFDAGVEDGILYYVMELLAGRGLDKRKDAGRAPREAEDERDPNQPEAVGPSSPSAGHSAPALDLKDFLDTFTPLADALALVHESGLIHRDIKPANIFERVPSRGPVLTDFGLAHAAGEGGLTQQGFVMGTLRFMAPEQARGEAPTPLCDLYSLGACMFEIVTGREPFADLRASMLLGARMIAELPAVSRLAPATPEAVAEIVDRCVRLEPRDRFASARELHAALLEAAGLLRRSRGSSARLRNPLPSGATAKAGPEAAAAPQGPSSGANASPLSGPRAATQALAADAVAAPDQTVLWTPGRVAAAALAGLFAVGLAGGAAALRWSGWRSPSARTDLRRPSVAVPPAPPPKIVPQPRPRSAVVQSLANEPAPEQRVELAGPTEDANRVALAATEGTFLAVWTKPDGRIAVRLGKQQGRLWTRPPVDGQLAANPQSELALVGRGGRFNLLYSATGAGSKPWVHAVSCGSEAEAWSTPVQLGRIVGYEQPIGLAAPPGDSRKGRLLAGWYSRWDATPGFCWMAETGVWSRPAAPPNGAGHGRLALAVTGEGEGLAIWSFDDRQVDQTFLVTCRSTGPGAPWSSVIPLDLKSPGFDRDFCTVAATEGRIYLQWAENQLPAHPMMIASSADGGHSFRDAYRIVWPYNKDKSSQLVAVGNRVWSSSAFTPHNNLVWVMSTDQGETWTRLRALSKLPPETKPASLAVTSEGDAWILWADEPGRAQVMRLP